MIIEISTDLEKVYGIQSDSVNYYIKFPHRDAYYGGPIVEIHFHDGSTLILPYKEGERFVEEYKKAKES